MKQKENNKCFHCEDQCVEDILHDGKHFCCQGCVMVYDILDSNGLCNYYDLEEQSKINLKGAKNRKYDFLSDEKVCDQLIDFKDENHTKITFNIPSIHCSSCIWLLEKLYKLKEGVLSSRVNFPAKKCFVSFNHNKVSLQEIVEILTTIGYEPDISLKDTEESSKKDKKLIYQIGFSGFVFGNIMMLSFPEYLGFKDGVDDELGHIFSILNIFLATPLLIYGGQSYLKSAYFSLRQKRLNIDVPISIGMLVLYFRSIYDIIFYIGPGFLDSLAGLLFFLLVGKWFQQMTYSSISFEKDYKSYFPVAVTVVENGVESAKMINDLLPGETIVIKNGELIPADGIIKGGESQIDYSFVNGEEKPVSVVDGDKVYAGGRQKGTSISVMLTKSVSQSYLLSLWNDEVFQKPTEMQASKLANLISKYFTWVVLTLSLGGYLYWYELDSVLALNVATSVLIISCPCALALAIPFIFGNVLRILARKGFYIKNTTIIEHLDQIDNVVFDKTGTLTDLRSLELIWHGNELPLEETLQIKALVSHSNHPISKGIYEKLKGDPSFSVVKFDEVVGKGVQGVVNNSLIVIGSNTFIESMLNTQLKYKYGTHIAVNNKYLGYYEKVSPQREGLDEVIDYFGSFSELSIISGDDDSDKKHLQSIFPKSSDLFFNQSPLDKLSFISKIQKSGGHSLMLGDGLNDAGALKQSNVGIVVADDVNNFTPACDIILNAERFKDLPLFIRFAKKSIKLVYLAYGIAFVYNVVGMTIALSGNLSPIIAAVLMPLSSITIVFFSFVSTIILANKMKVSQKSDINHFLS